eukprot:850017-Amphidinium_carterae.1
MMFAIRVPVGDATRTRQELRMDIRRRYVIGNVPNDLPNEELCAAFKDAGWVVEPVEGSKRCRKFSASLLVKAAAPLMMSGGLVTVYPIRYNNEIINLKIEAKARQASPERQKLEPTEVASICTWRDALIGRGKSKGAGSGHGAKSSGSRSAEVPSDDGEQVTEVAAKKRRTDGKDQDTEMMVSTEGANSASVGASAASAAPAAPFEPTTTAMRESKLSRVENEMHQLAVNVDNK